MKDVRDLKGFARYLGSAIPLQEDLNMEEIKIIDTPASFKPFRHRIYAISVYIDTSTGQATLFFKVPFQVLTAESKPSADLCFYIAFTDGFLSQHQNLSSQIFDLPFLRMDQAAALAIDQKEIDVLKPLFDQMMEEFIRQNPDSRQMIASYLHTYLLQIRRIYTYRLEVPLLDSVGRQNDLVITGQFQFLLDNYFRIRESNESVASRSVKYYAERMSIHPNYLNASVKRTTGSTAQQLLVYRLISLAKSMISQTNSSIKEISYQLTFNEPSHFVNFFKRHTGMTPGKFRDYEHSNRATE